MGTFTINSAESGCPTLSVYNLSITIETTLPNTSFGFRPQDITTTFIDWGDCIVNSGVLNHTFITPGTYTIKAQVISLSVNFVLPDANIVSFNRFPGLIDIPNAPKLNVVPSVWLLYRNKLSSQELEKIFKGLNDEFPMVQNYQYPNNFFILADNQNNANKVLSVSGINEAYNLINKKWFLNYAIDDIKSANRYLTPGDSGLLDTAGELSNDSNGAVMFLSQSGLFINSAINLKNSGPIPDARQELYIRLQFKKPGEIYFGHTTFLNYDKITNTVSPFPINPSQFPAGTVVRGVFEKKYGTYYGGVGLIPNTSPYVISLSY